MKVYGDIKSGNCYKIKLTLELLGLPYEWIHVDIMKGETKSDAFLAKSAAGKIPLVQLDTGEYLTESNAIINYIAHDSLLLPHDPLAVANVQQWQFFEQYSHEPYIAVARFIQKYQGLPTERLAEYESKQAGGYKALDLMEAELNKNDYLGSDTLTTADIALYAYTHVCHEGGFSLLKYPAIQTWLKRIEGHKSYVSMV